MPKKMHSLRFSERTWNQLGRIAKRFRVEDRTRAIEILAEREDVEMSQNEDVLKDYQIGEQIQIEYPATGKDESAIITAFTAGEFGRLDGVMVEFDDGTFFQVAAKYLEKK